MRLKVAPYNPVSDLWADCANMPLDVLLTVFMTKLMLQTNIAKYPGVQPNLFLDLKGEKARMPFAVVRTVNMVKLTLSTNVNARCHGVRPAHLLDYKGVHRCFVQRTVVMVTRML